MPFDKETASISGRKGGGLRWKDKNPDTIRNKRLSVNVTDTEFKEIAKKAEAEGLSKAELVIRAVEAYKSKRKPTKE